LNLSKKTSIHVCVAAISLILAVNGTAGEKGQSQDKLVAKVNEAEINASEVEKALQVALAQNPQIKTLINSEEQAEAFRKTLLDQLISTELLYQEGKKLSISGLKELVDEEESKLKARFPNEGDFEALLKEQDLTEGVLREKIEKGIRIQKLIDERIKKDIAVPEAEVKSFYEENRSEFVEKESVKASHILIRVTEDSSESEDKDAQKRIKKLLKRSRGGEDFATLARENSEDPSVSQNDGDLGYFTREQMVPEFSEAAFNLKAGDISDVVKTSYGYHIIKCEEKKPERDLSFDEVREDITKYRENMIFQKRLGEFISSLRKSAHVEVF
jgi:parvulin-like peptidyl-prolyl isomerase